MEINWCNLFKEIKNNPKGRYPLSDDDLVNARKHIQTCYPCFRIVHEMPDEVIIINLN